MNKESKGHAFTFHPGSVIEFQQVSRMFIPEIFGMIMDYASNQFLLSFSVPKFGFAHSIQFVIAENESSPEHNEAKTCSRILPGTSHQGSALLRTGHQYRVLKFVDKYSPLKFSKKSLNDESAQHCVRYWNQLDEFQTMFLQISDRTVIHVDTPWRPDEPNLCDIHFEVPKRTFLTPCYLFSKINQFIPVWKLCLNSELQDSLVTDWLGFKHQKPRKL